MELDLTTILGLLGTAGFAILILGRKFLADHAHKKRIKELGSALEEHVQLLNDAKKSRIEKLRQADAKTAEEVEKKAAEDIEAAKKLDTTDVIDMIRARNQALQNELARKQTPG